MSRKRPHQQQQQQQNKRPFTGEQRAQGQHRFQGQQKQQPHKAIVTKSDEKPLFKECNRRHFGKCLYGTGKFYKCGGDHVIGDCPKLRQPMTGRAFVMPVEEAKPNTTLITCILNILALLYCFIA